MKFTANKTDLLHAVQVAARALPSQTSEPAFLNLRIEACRDDLREGVTLLGIGHQTSIEASTNATVAESGAVAIPGSLLVDLVRQIQTAGGEDVTVALDGARRFVSGHNTGMARS